MIGFAKRSGTIVFGYDNLSKAKGVRLIAVSDTASDNLKSDTERLASRLNVPTVYARSLETIVGNNVKALGFTDKNMARAVADYISDGDTEYNIKFGSRR